MHEPGRSPCRERRIVSVMARSPLEDAFAHNVWATDRLLEACMEVTREQLEATVPGTFGTLIATLRHMVSADSWYRFRLLGDRYPPISDEEEEALDVAGVRSLAAEVGASWPEVLDRDPDEVITVRRDDGSETHAPVGIRLAQILHHGTDHRSQICTALTQLGIEPPEIDLWAYGVHAGRVTEIPPSS
jgi:uncharacterized damage-inducible protein DinB